MDMSPKVSVIVPTYNRQEVLGECLAGFMVQTFKDFEVVVANDGGQSVQQIVAEFSELRIQLIELAENIGQVAARNKALSVAKGKYIALCDDDDVFLASHLADLVAKMPGSDLVYSDSKLQVTNWVNGRKQVAESVLFACEFELAKLLKTNFIISSAVMYRADLHEELGPFDETFVTHEDWDWYLRVAQRRNSAAHLGVIKRVPIMSVHCSVYPAGKNITNQPQKSGCGLDYLCSKHKLGKIPLSNFYLMAKEEIRRCSVL